MNHPHSISSSVRHLARKLQADTSVLAIEADDTTVVVTVRGDVATHVPATIDGHPVAVRRFLPCIDDVQPGADLPPPARTAGALV